MTLFPIFHPKLWAREIAQLVAGGLDSSPCNLRIDSFCSFWTTPSVQGFLAISGITASELRQPYGHMVCLNQTWVGRVKDKYPNSCTIAPAPRTDSWALLSVALKETNPKLNYSFNFIFIKEQYIYYFLCMSFLFCPETSFSRRQSLLGVCVKVIFYSFVWDIHSNLFLSIQTFDNIWFGIHIFPLIFQYCYYYFF